MTKTAELHEKLLDHMIDENKELRQEIKKLKGGIKKMFEDLEHMTDVIEQIEDFAQMNEDQKTAELLRLRENLKVAEELCGIGESGGYEGFIDEE